MEMTFEDAVAYPVIYAPDHAFAWEGKFLATVYHELQEWSEGVRTGNIFGWAHKHELGMYGGDDEVENLVFMTVQRSGVCLWVAGSDKMWMVAKYEEHIRITKPDVVVNSFVSMQERYSGNDLDYVMCMLGMDDGKSNLEELSFRYAREKDARRAADPAFEPDDEVLEELSRLHNGMPIEVVMTDAQLDEQLADERFERSAQEIADVLEVQRQEQAQADEDESAFNVFETLADAYIEDTVLEHLARQHARSLIDGQLATPVVRQILEDIGTLMCMSGLGQDEEVIERVMLFTQDRYGCADHMQIILEEIGKTVHVRVTEF